MPTARPRHMITETDPVAQALEVAADAWPEHREDKSTLIKLLLATGKDFLETQKQVQKESRLKAIRDVSRQFADVWPPNWQDEVKVEWPD